MILIFLFILLSVAFITIGERKIMGSMQRRIGPNFVGWYGLLQPIADAIKLVIKETIIPQDSNKFLFYFSPLITLIFSLMLWGVIPLNDQIFIFENNFTILISLCVGSLSVYGIIFAGWSANSKYALLGSIRSAAQVVSYELVLTTIIITLIVFNNTLNFIDIVKNQSIISNIIIFFPLFIIFLISIIAETNRAPFDLPEAESELVSGFNTEHGSTIFVLFFLAEYSNILYWSSVTSLLFLGGYNTLTLGFKTSIIIFIYIWVRATLPRLKYNQLMNFCWNNLLTWSFSMLILILGISIMVRLR